MKNGLSGISAVLREALGGWRVDRAAKRARRGEADVVEQHDEHVGAPFGGRNGSIGANFASGSLAS
jgi:hypothetical protein